jgi:nucleotide-binding universal stress UspA family protein
MTDERTKPGHSMSTLKRLSSLSRVADDEPPVGRIVCGVDGSEHARHAAISALGLAERLGARLTLLHVTPTRTMVPVDSLPMPLDPRAYRRSAELAFSESETAFDSHAPEITAAEFVAPLIDERVEIGPTRPKAVWPPAPAYGTRRSR